MFQAEARQMNDSFAALRSRIAAVKALAGQLQTARAAGADIGPLVEDLAVELSAFSGEGKR